MRKTRIKKPPSEPSWSEAQRLQQLELAKRLSREIRLERAVNREKNLHRKAEREQIFAELALYGFKRSPQRRHRVTYPIYVPRSPYTVTAVTFDGFSETTSTTSVVPSTLGLYTAYRNQSSVDTAAFLAKARRIKKLPENPFSMEVRQYQDTEYHELAESPSGLRITRTADSCCHLNWFQPWDYRDANHIALVNSIAHSKLHNRVNKMHVNIAQMFAERKQTTSLVINSANRIVLAARAMRRGDWKSFEKALSLEVYSTHPNALKAGLKLDRTWERVRRTPPSKRLANHWLEYTFGWTPLLSDIYGSAELLASHAVGDLYHERAVAKKNLIQKSYWQDANGIKYWYSQDVTIRYVVKYELDSYGRAALSQTGIDNPALLAWELLPYSFVVDWFYNVSGYLKKLNTFDGFVFKSGTKSTIYRGKLTTLFTRNITNPGPQPNRLTATGSSVKTQVKYDREVLGTWPSNIPPTLRNPLGNGPMWKLATSASLLTQVFRKQRGDSTRRILDSFGKPIEP